MPSDPQDDVMKKLLMLSNRDNFVSHNLSLAGVIAHIWNQLNIPIFRRAYDAAPASGSQSEQGTICSGWYRLNFG